MKCDTTRDVIDIVPMLLHLGSGSSKVLMETRRLSDISELEESALYLPWRKEDDIRGRVMSKATGRPICPIDAGENIDKTRAILSVVSSSALDIRNK